MHHRTDSIVIRQVLSDLAAIDRAGRIDELPDRLAEAQRQWKAQHHEQTIGQTLRAEELADLAARLLAVPREVCHRQLANMLGWPEAAREAVHQLAVECSVRVLPVRKLAQREAS